MTTGAFELAFRKKEFNVDNPKFYVRSHIGGFHLIETSLESTFAEFSTPVVSRLYLST